MSVHPNGDGIAWVNDIDVDQPHGLDYRSWNHLANALSKRINKEHLDFADSTVGGDHVPGRCQVLAFEDGTDADLTKYFSDGSYFGHGIVWDTSGRLWCITVDGSYSGAVTPKVVKMNPDKQWEGGDVTWTGAHQFDSSVSVIGSSEFSAMVSDGTCDFKKTIDISVANVTGLLSCASDVAITGDITISGGLYIDGSVTADTTEYAFGDMTGISLFYDPTKYDTDESITFPNGLIMKCGTVGALTGATPATITFGDAFPGGIRSISVVAVEDIPSADDFICVNSDFAVGSFKIEAKQNLPGGGFWTAWGY